MGKSNAVKQAKIDPSLSGKEKLKVLLAAKGHTPTTFARIPRPDIGKPDGFLDTQVFMCISNYRPYPEIRDDLARFLEMPRKVIDGLIESGGEQGEAPRTDSVQDAREDA